MKDVRGNRPFHLRVAASLDPPTSLAASSDVRPRDDACGPAADYQLASRCVAGEVAAWEQLYTQCHDPLCLSITAMLGRRGGDRDLVDEIAARVWYRLVDNDGELLARYSPTRGARLTTFMRALARDEMCRHFRATVRRRNRESIAVQSRRRNENGSADILRSDLNSFLTTLTPQEHAFCCEVLMGEPCLSGISRARTNAWQLTHRVYQKFRRFFGG
ncbi:MAG: hypothetical protein ABFC63_03360 [Thermoguttaceae bacterium]